MRAINQTLLRIVVGIIHKKETFLIKKKKKKKKIPKEAETEKKREKC
jgi:hypothetical protein